MLEAAARPWEAPNFPRAGKKKSKKLKKLLRTCWGLRSSRFNLGSGSSFINFSLDWFFSRRFRDVGFGFDVGGVGLDDGLTLSGGSRGGLFYEIQRMDKTKRNEFYTCRTQEVLMKI